MIRKGTIWPGEFSAEEIARYTPLQETHAFECGFVEWRARLCYRRVFAGNAVALLAYDLGQECALGRTLKEAPPSDNA